MIIVMISVPNFIIKYIYIIKYKNENEIKKKYNIGIKIL